VVVPEAPNPHKAEATAVLKIGGECQRMGSVCEELLRGDDAEALEHARELIGLPSKSVRPGTPLQSVEPTL
jgi:hypothetical protein